MPRRKSPVASTYVTMAKYRIYLDEVGNSDIESSDNPNHRFLSLTGVVIALDHVRDVVHPEMEAIKRRFLDSHPDDPVILHRKEMLNARPPFSMLRDSTVRSEFDAALLAALLRWDYDVITVCIDKKRHKETYTTWRYDPYHYCMAVLLERYVFLLEGADGVGDVMAESRGGREDRRLKDSYERLWEDGTDYVTGPRFAARLSSRQLKVKNKANNVAGLQLADLLAHPSRQEILLSEGLVGRPLAPFGSRVASILHSKYYRRGQRVFGRKLL